MNGPTRNGFVAATISANPVAVVLIPMAVARDMGPVILSNGAIAGFAPDRTLPVVRAAPVPCRTEAVGNPSSPASPSGVIAPYCDGSPGKGSALPSHSLWSSYLAGGDWTFSTPVS